MPRAILREARAPSWLWDFPFFSILLEYVLTHAKGGVGGSPWLF